MREIRPDFMKITPGKYNKDDYTVIWYDGDINITTHGFDINGAYTFMATYYDETGVGYD